MSDYSDSDDESGAKSKAEMTATQKLAAINKELDDDDIYACFGKDPFRIEVPGYGSCPLRDVALQREEEEQVEEVRLTHASNPRHDPPGGLRWQ